MNRQYPLYETQGDPRELGRRHGEQARAQIHGYLDYFTATSGVVRERLRERALRFRPLFERLCPELLIEVEGLAEGAGLPTADALIAQLRGELTQVTDGACTTFAVGRSGTAERGTFVGQTSDNPAELEAFGYVLKLRPAGRPAALIWTFGGMLGYHGVNEHGVAHFANALGGGPAWKFALSHYPLKRKILEQRSLDDVLKLMREFPVCSNGNYMLADGDGAIVDVELTSDGPFVLQDRADYRVHSNHFLCGAHACEANWRHSLPDSFPRLERLQSLIAQKFGAIRLEDVVTFLSDHDGFPVSICRHSHVAPPGPMLDSSGKTVAALIAEPERRRLHVAYGNPCQNRFVAYAFDD